MNPEPKIVLASPTTPTSSEHLKCRLKPLQELPPSLVIDREYRERLGSSASRGYVESLSVYMDSERKVFLTIHGLNGEGKDFHLNTKEGSWYEDTDGGIDLTMKSGHNFYFYPRSRSS